MIPQAMISPHTPPASYGDCHRACLASIIEIPIDQVPHFFNGPEPEDVGNDPAWSALQAWLREHGWDIVAAQVVAETVEAALELMGADSCNQGRHWIFTGVASGGVPHSVVACGGEIVWDPSPGKVGVATGFYDDSAGWLFGCQYLFGYRPEVYRQVSEFQPSEPFPGLAEAMDRQLARMADLDEDT